MKKSEMSTAQINFRDIVVKKLLSEGWTGPREQEAYEADLILDTELTMNKRNKQCLMQFRYSFEYEYLAFLVAQPSLGNADYIMYFKSLEDSLDLINQITTHFIEMSFYNSIELFRKISSERPGDIYFFDGKDSIELTPENIEKIVRNSPINLKLSPGYFKE